MCLTSEASHGGCGRLRGGCPGSRSSTVRRSQRKSELQGPKRLREGPENGADMEPQPAWYLVGTCS
eukprot:2908671-Rhodomonas_salina.1